MVKIGIWILMAIVAPHFLNAADTCPLCSETVLKNQKFFEDENVLILYDYRPIIEGHCLIVPKRHIENFHDMSSEELISTLSVTNKLFGAAKRVYGSTSYYILQKNGKAAGQSISHVHFHFFPRKEGQYTDIGLLARYYLSSLKGPISQEKIDSQRNLLSKEINVLSEDFSPIQEVQ